MPINTATQIWEPLPNQKTKIFFYSSFAIICQAINIRNQTLCSNKLYGTHYDRCRECGAIVCLWHSGYRYRGYKVCDACYYFLNKILQSSRKVILCNICKEKFNSYIELQRHYLPQKIGKGAFHKVYKIQHGKLLSEYLYEGPWAYKVPQYNSLDAKYVHAIHPDRSVRIMKEVNPTMPVGRFRRGWVMPFDSSVSTLDEVESGRLNIFKTSKRFVVDADRNNIVKNQLFDPDYALRPGSPVSDSLYPGLKDTYAYQEMTARANGEMWDENEALEDWLND